VSLITRPPSPGGSSQRTNVISIGYSRAVVHGWMSLGFLELFVIAMPSIHVAIINV